MSRSSLRWVRRGALTVAVLLVGGFAVGSLVGSKNTDQSSAGAQAVNRALSRAGTVAQPVAGRAPVYGAPSTAGAGSSSNLDSAGPAGALALPAPSQSVIKTGDIGIEVRKDRIDSAWQRVFQIAQANGGFVLSSGQGGAPIPAVEGDGRIGPITTGDGDGRFADIVIRVPADKFEAVVGALTNGDLGRVARRGFSGQDVSQEFVDLDGRLRNARAQEAVLLRLMAKVTSIGDTIAVQQQLSQVQGQIEEISGRVRYLKNQTALATISVHLAEPGAAGAFSDGPSFTKAWETAVDGLERMGTAALIGGIWLSPFALVGIAWLATRRFRTPVGQAPQL